MAKIVGAGRVVLFCAGENWGRWGCGGGLVGRERDFGFVGFAFRALRFSSSSSWVCWFLMGVGFRLGVSGVNPNGCFLFGSFTCD